MTSRAELAEALRKVASWVITEEWGSAANSAALLVMRHADEIDRPIAQTAIVAGLGGQEVLVRIAGMYVPDNAVQVDTRPRPTDSWRPVAVERIDVRHE